MPKATPLPDWTGQDVFIIGGGSSLRDFDFSQLIDTNTIGCNQAFTLGADICNILIFCDGPFWQKFGVMVAQGFDGWVVGSGVWIGDPPAISSWYKYKPRQDEGLTPRGCPELAFNGNTGASAINLALQLGARRVYLLGFDCNPGNRPRGGNLGTHWHDLEMERTHQTVYQKFIDGFRAVAAALPNVFLGTGVYNISNGASDLDVFPTVTFESVGLIPRKAAVLV